MVSQVSLSHHSRFNGLLWGLSGVSLLAGFGSYYYFTQSSWLIKGGLWLVLLAVSAVLAMQTVQGKQLWTLWRESWQELKKVYWPSRQETLRMTLAVLVMVSIMGLLLWGVDAVLLRVVAWLTGH